MPTPGPDWADDDFARADDTAGKSKSQVKRELLALDPLARRLLALPDKQRHSLALPADVHDALMAAKAMQRGALQRQLRYVRGLLAAADHVAIAQALEHLRRPHQDEVAAMHELERWRETLIAGDQAMLDGLFERYPAIDRQHLVQLIRNSQKERAAQRSPKSARLLFKYLQEIRAGG